MAKSYPHMRDTEFPNVGNVDVYKYQNEFDYSQYNRSQMRITICSVPWDVGLIHVGNAQIGGLGNVVYFESETARDEYLDSIENKFTWETKYRAYHDSGFIEVPLPYERCVLYNYCYVEYDPLPVEWGTGGKNKFFFFIRACEYLAPNTCKIEILRDTWQTYIYDVNIGYMMLERGHAPLSVTSADNYLTNPVENNAYLLAEDVNYGGAMKPKYASSIVLNHENMQAVIISSADLGGNWGSASNNWNVPAQTHLTDGATPYYAYAIDAAFLSELLEYFKSNMPQFFQTVQGVFFISANLIALGEAIALGDFEIKRVEQQVRDFDLLTLTKQQFGYGPKYENLAKLYTYPYAYLEISDENGNKNQIRIEETSGDLSLTVATNLAYPFMALNAHLNGVGTGTGEITFANATDHTFAFNGRWYGYLYEWSIPSFAVIQSNADYYAFSTYFDREQRELEASTAYSNATDSADVAKTNADASANTAKANADASATTDKTNSDASANTAKTNADASANAAKDNADASANTAKDNADASANAAKANADASATTAKTNADASAKTAYDDSILSTNTNKDNADASATAAKANADASANTDKVNSDASANTAYVNATDSATTANANGLSSANVSLLNAIASAETAKTISDENAILAETNTNKNANIAKTTSDKIADAIFDNAKDSADTAKANADRSATTTKDNAEVVAALVQDNAYDLADAEYDISKRDADANKEKYDNERGLAREYLNLLTTTGEAFPGYTGYLGQGAWETVSKIGDDWDEDYLMNILVTGAQQNETVMTSVINGVSGASNAVMGGALMGGVGGSKKGPSIGIATGLVGSAISLASASASIPLIVSTIKAVQDASLAAGDAKTKHAIDYTYNMYLHQKNFETNKFNAETTWLDLNATLMQDTAIDDADDRRTVEKDNAKKTLDRTVFNIRRTKTTTDTNNAATQSTDKNNAERTHTATTDNNRDVYLNATDISEQVRLRAKANNQLEYDKATGNAQRNYNYDVENDNRTLQTSLDNAERALDTTLDNNTRTQDTALANNARTQNIALTNNGRTATANTQNAERDWDTAKDNNARTQSTALANNARTQETALYNNGRTQGTALANNARTQETALANNARTLNTALANNTRDYDTRMAVNLRTQETALANNARKYALDYSLAGRNRNTALEAIANDIKQAALEAPKVFGSTSDAETATTRPQGVFCNIVTQAKDAIEQAGDYFLRFGYALNRAWEFETFNLMPHFTYWKASDMWISGNNVPDKYLDEIRFYLLGGVCVWRNPDDIGRISIYDNL